MNKKIPCIKCTPELWEYVKPYLEEWGYEYSNVVNFEEFPILVLNIDGIIGNCSNIINVTMTDFNRELVINVEEFLQKAAELKGFTYKRKDIVEINGVEIKSGMVIITEDITYWVVFPTENNLAVINYKGYGWYRLNDFIRIYNKKIIEIRDLVKNNSLNDGKILWERPKEVIITMDEIAKKFGYPVEIIKIKK